MSTRRLGGSLKAHTKVSFLAALWRVSASSRFLSSPSSGANRLARVAAQAAPPQLFDETKSLPEVTQGYLPSLVARLYILRAHLVVLTRPSVKRNLKKRTRFGSSFLRHFPFFYSQPTYVSVTSQDVVTLDSALIYKQPAACSEC